MPIGLSTLILLCAFLLLLVNAAPSNQTTPSPSQPSHTLSRSIPNTHHNCTQRPNNTTRPHCGPALGYDSLKKGSASGGIRTHGSGGTTSGAVEQGPTSVVALLGFWGGLIMVGGVVME